MAGEIVEFSSNGSPARTLRDGWTRRELLRGAGVAFGALALPIGRAIGADSPFQPSEDARAALGSSPLVYISPLKADGSESSCHGEVWFTFDEGDVLIATGSDRWKTRALDKGWSRARIWVGDFGPVGKSEDRFRQAPNFVAEARRDKDPAAFERLMTSFAGKYADGWDKWEPRFRKGYADGSRVLIRYAPDGP
jgi:hypothetical protein